MTIVVDLFWLGEPISFKNILKEVYSSNVVVNRY